MALFCEVGLRGQQPLPYAALILLGVGTFEPTLATEVLSG